MHDIFSLFREIKTFFLNDDPRGQYELDFYSTVINFRSSANVKQNRYLWRLKLLTYLKIMKLNVFRYDNK